MWFKNICTWYTLWIFRRPEKHTHFVKTIRITFMSTLKMKKKLAILIVTPIRFMEIQSSNTLLEFPKETIALLLANLFLFLYEAGFFSKNCTWKKITRCGLLLDIYILTTCYQVTNFTSILTSTPYIPVNFK